MKVSELTPEDLKYKNLTSIIDKSGNEDINKDISQIAPPIKKPEVTKQGPQPVQKVKQQEPITEQSLMKKALESLEAYPKYKQLVLPTRKEEAKAELAKILKPVFINNARKLSAYTVAKEEADGFFNDLKNQNLYIQDKTTKKTIPIKDWLLSYKYSPGSFSIPLANVSVVIPKTSGGFSPADPKLYSNMVTGINKAQTVMLKNRPDNLNDIVTEALATAMEQAASIPLSKQEQQQENVLKGVANLEGALNAQYENGTFSKKQHNAYLSQIESLKKDPLNNLDSINQLISKYNVQAKEMAAMPGAGRELDKYESIADPWQKLSFITGLDPTKSYLGRQKLSEIPEIVGGLKLPDLIRTRLIDSAQALKGGQLNSVDFQKRIEEAKTASDIYNTGKKNNLSDAEADNLVKATWGYDKNRADALVNAIINSPSDQVRTDRLNQFASMRNDEIRHEYLLGLEPRTEAQKKAVNANINNIEKDIAYKERELYGVSEKEFRDNNLALQKYDQSVKQMQNRIKGMQDNLKTVKNSKLREKAAADINTQKQLLQNMQIKQKEEQAKRDNYLISIQKATVGIPDSSKPDYIAQAQRIQSAQSQQQITKENTKPQTQLQSIRSEMLKDYATASPEEKKYIENKLNKWNMPITSEERSSITDKIISNNQEQNANINEGDRQYEMEQNRIAQEQQTEPIQQASSDNLLPVSDEQREINQQNAQYNQMNALQEYPSTSEGYLDTEAISQQIANNQNVNTQTQLEQNRQLAAEADRKAKESSDNFKKLMEGNNQ